MNKTSVVIFGNRTFADLTRFCLLHDSPWQVVAFTVDKEHVTEKVHDGLPVVPFEDLPQIYPPASTKILISLGYAQINGLRKDRFYQAMEMGYEPITYVSSRAVVWPDTPLGKNCLVFEQAVLQPLCRIGDNVIIRSGANIGHHCLIGNHSFVSTGVTFGGNVVVGEQCFFGVGAVVRNGIRIADRTFVGAGAVVLTDTEPDGVYVRNPARKIDKTPMEVSSR